MPIFLPLHPLLNTFLFLMFSISSVSACVSSNSIRRNIDVEMSKADRWEKNCLSKASSYKLKIKWTPEEAEILKQQSIPEEPGILPENLEKYSLETISIKKQAVDVIKREYPDTSGEMMLSPAKKRVTRVRQAVATLRKKKCPDLTPYVRQVENTIRDLRNEMAKQLTAKREAAERERIINEEMAIREALEEEERLASIERINSLFNGVRPSWLEHSLPMQILMMGSGGIIQTDGSPLDQEFKVCYLRLLFQLPEDDDDKSDKLAAIMCACLAGEFARRVDYGVFKRKGAEIEPIKKEIASGKCGLDWAKKYLTK